MKSKYIKPQTLVINMGALQLLSGSGGVSDDGKKATLFTFRGCYHNYK